MGRIAATYRPIDAALPLEHSAGHRNDLTKVMTDHVQMIAEEVPQSRQGFFRSYVPGPKREQLIQIAHGHCAVSRLTVLGARPNILAIIRSE